MTVWSRLLPRTLTARLVVTAIGLVAAVSLVIAALTTLAIHRSLVDRLDSDVQSALRRVTEMPEPSTPPRESPYGDPDDDDRPGPGNQAPGTLIGFLDGSAGQAFVLTEAYGRPRELDDAAVDELREVAADGRAHAVDLGGVGGYRVAARTLPDGTTVVSGLPTHEVDETVAALLGIELLLALVGVGAAAGLGLVLVRRQLRPLTEVTATADRVSRLPLGEGEIDLDERVPAHLTDERTEAGQVGAALNRLLTHVESSLEARHRSEQQVRQFVADASHELRTPLATIHGYAELSRRTPDDPVALGSALQKVETETDRMSALVEDLLLLARLDAGRPLERAEVDLTHLLLESVTDARVLGPDHHWRIDLPDEPLTVTGDEHRLHQVVRNLLGNARAHTPPGTTVTVAAATAPGDAVRLTVHDDGPGLAPGLVGEVFDRFTRGDSSRTRASGGAGLGLSLVAAIAEAHGGTAEVDSEPGDTTFAVTLPR